MVSSEADLVSWVGGADAGASVWGRRGGGRAVAKVRAHIKRNARRLKENFAERGYSR